MNCPLCHKTEHDTLGDKNGYSIVACRSCGLRHVGNMPSDGELNVYYAKYHGNAKNVRNATRKVRRWWRKLLPLRLLAGNGEFLDLGCNTGFAVEAARRLGFRATGYDLSEEAVTAARQAYPGCEFHHGTASDVAASGKLYDAVVCAEMIEHLTELDAFARALPKVVKPGGMLYLTTPDASRFTATEEFLDWKEVCPPHHLIYFGRLQVKRFLEETGFKVLLFMPVFHKRSIRVVARRLSADADSKT